MKTLNELRDDLAREQKKGLPFIGASVVIWGLIAVISFTNLNIEMKNMLTFCCSCPLMPLSFLLGKLMKVDIFSKENPLSRLGFIFTLNQLIYLLIVMWVFSAQPESMVMVYAMVFGAHLLPYSWIYRSKTYVFFSIEIPIAALVMGCVLGVRAVALTGFFTEIVLTISLLLEIFFAKNKTEKIAFDESCDKGK